MTGFTTSHESYYYAMLVKYGDGVYRRCYTQQLRDIYYERQTLDEQDREAYCNSELADAPNYKLYEFGRR